LRRIIARHRCAILGDANSGKRLFGRIILRSRMLHLFGDAFARIAGMNGDIRASSSRGAARQHHRSRIFAPYRALRWCSA